MGGKSRKEVIMIFLRRLPSFHPGIVPLQTRYRPMEVDA